MPISGDQAWAVILCKFSDRTEEPVSVELCQTYFCTPGSGGLSDYWHDLSYGQVSLTGSKVFGPLTLTYSWAEAQKSAADKKSANQTSSRTTFLQDAVDDVSDRVDFSPFSGVIVVFNAILDSGAAGTTVKRSDGTRRGVPAATFDPAAFVPEAMGQLIEHESGHMLGLPHTRLLGAESQYSDGWSIMGGQVDDLSNPDGSGKDWRFNSSNPNLLYTRCGPGLIAPSMHLLGWIQASRIAVYNGDVSAEIGLAALNHPEADGFLSVQAPPTYSGSSGFTVELRWNDRWDAGLPRPAFILHKLMPAADGVESNLVPRTPTVHDWVAGETYSSASEGIGVDFLSIDPTTHTGRICVRRTVGQSADAIVAGGWGMIALQLGTGVPFRYLGSPGQWEQVGGPAAQFAISGDALYGLASDRQNIWRYTGAGQEWTHVGGSAAQIVATSDGLYTLTPDKNTIARY